jgi:hypothetical protein
MMTDAQLFPTLMGSHWRSMFEAHRRQGAIEGNAILAQIRGAVRRDMEELDFTQGSSVAERLTHNQEVTGSTPVPASVSLGTTLSELKAGPVAEAQASATWPGSFERPAA